MRQGFYKRLRKLKHLHLKEVRVQIMPTFNCSQNCTYCTRHFTGKMTVKKDEHQLTAEQWLERIDRFPLPVDIVTISGGEPSIYFDIADLVNGLTKRGCIVTMFSNCRQVNEDIKPNKRLRIIATLHVEADGTRFNDNVDWYRVKGIRVDVDITDRSMFGMNLGGGRKNSETKIKGIIKIGTFSWKECNEYKVFNYAPDGKLFTSPGQMWYEYVHGKIRGSIIWDT